MNHNFQVVLSDFLTIVYLCNANLGYLWKVVLSNDVGENLGVSKVSFLPGHVQLRGLLVKSMSLQVLLCLKQIWTKVILCIRI